MPWQNDVAQTQPNDPPAVRVAVSADAAAVAAIYNHYVDLGGSTMDQQHWSDGQVRKWMHSLTNREALLVVDRGGTVEGWGALKRYSERAGYQACCEESLFVAPQATGRGIGKCLMDALITRCQEFGYHHVVAKICADNLNSIEFHLRNGFEIVGTQREIGFEKGRWVDVAILQRILADVPIPSD